MHDAPEFIGIFFLLASTLLKTTLTSLTFAFISSVHAVERC